MDSLLKEELEILSREGLDTLSKEELKELRRRIIAAMPREHIIARMSGLEGMPREEYDKFVHTQLELYKQERTITQTAG